MQEAVLQGRVEELAASNAVLKAEAADLLIEIDRLKIECMQQFSCNCGGVQPFLGNEADAALASADSGWFDG